MHSIYFARHGETVWNVENKICGMTDSPLTEKGRQQARELGRKVRESGVRIDEILYSPLSRAADPVVIEVRYDKELSIHPFAYGLTEAVKKQEKAGCGGDGHQIIVKRYHDDV